MKNKTSWDRTHTSWRCAKLAAKHWTFSLRDQWEGRHWYLRRAYPPLPGFESHWKSFWNQRRASHGCFMVWGRPSWQETGQFPDWWTVQWKFREEETVTLVKSCTWRVAGGSHWLLPSLEFQNSLAVQKISYKAMRLRLRVWPRDT